MMIRDAVQAIAALGRFPGYGDEPSEAVVATLDRLLRQITPPLCRAEAIVLSGVLGPDDCYGMAWTTLHLIETCLEWPIQEAIDIMPPQWREIALERIVHHD